MEYWEIVVTPLYTCNLYNIVQQLYFNNKKTYSKKKIMKSIPYRGIRYE